MTQMIQADGAQTNYEYDTSSRMIREQDPAATVYNGGSGNTVATVTVRAKTEWQYDALGNRTVETRYGLTAASNEVTLSRFDAQGHVVAAWDALNNRTDNAVDAAGHILQQAHSATDVDGVAHTYRTYFTYDALGRERTRQNITDENTAAQVTGDSTWSSYNAFGEVSARGINASTQTEYRYDKLGHLFWTNADTGTPRVYVYDATGNAVIEVSQANGTDLNPLNSPFQAQSIAPTLVQMKFSLYDARNQITDVFQAPMDFTDLTGALTASQQQQLLPPTSGSTPGTTQQIGASDPAPTGGGWNFTKSTSASSGSYGLTEGVTTAPAANIDPTAVTQAGQGQDPLSLAPWTTTNHYTDSPTQTRDVTVTRTAYMDSSYVVHETITTTTVTTITTTGASTTPSPDEVDYQLGTAKVNQQTTTNTTTTTTNRTVNTVNNSYRSQQITTTTNTVLGGNTTKATQLNYIAPQAVNFEVDFVTDTTGYPDHPPDYYEWSVSIPSIDGYGSGPTDVMVEYAGQVTYDDSSVFGPLSLSAQLSPNSVIPRVRVWKGGVLILDANVQSYPNAVSTFTLYTTPAIAVTGVDPNVVSGVYVWLGNGQGGYGSAVALTRSSSDSSYWVATGIGAPNTNWQYGLYANGGQTFLRAVKGYSTSDPSSRDLFSTSTVTRDYYRSQVNDAYIANSQRIDVANSIQQSNYLRQLLYSVVSGSTLSNQIRRSTTHDAFGEVTGETDGRGNLTQYGYNELGQLIRKQDPQVDYTGENGVKVSNFTPVTQYYVDAMSRTIGSVDANNYATTQAIRYGRLTAQFNPDGGIEQRYYDLLTQIQLTQDFWYTFDSKNRFTTTMGQLVNGQIVRGSTGYDITYNAADQRKTQTTTDTGGKAIKETYSYDDNGFLTIVKINPDAVNVAGDGVMRAQRVNNVVGDRTDYYEYNAAGTATSHHHYTYDKDHRLTQDKDFDNNRGTDYTLLTDGRIDKTVSFDNVNPAAATVTFQYNYDKWDTYLQKQITVSGIAAGVAGWRNGTTTFDYDVDGHVKQAYDHAADRTIQYVNNQNGQTLKRLEFAGANTAGKPAVIRQFYYLYGKPVGDQGTDKVPSRIDYAQELRGTELEGNGNRTYVESKRFEAATALWQAWMSGDPLASWNAIYDSAGKAQSFQHKDIGERVIPVSSADFDQNFQPINQGFPPATVGTYIVRTGDTLQSIAANVWGDASLWYLIADANGLQGTETLTADMRLVLPNVVTNIHNNATTFRPIDPSLVLGDTSPTMPSPPAPPVGAQGGGCGIIGTIILVIVAIIVTIYTAGAASAAIGAALGAAEGSVAAGVAAVAGGAIGAAAGSIVSQGVGIAIGAQDSFSWSAVGKAAIGGAVGAGLFGVSGYDAYSAPSGNWLGEATSAFGEATPYVQAGLNNAVASVLTQGISVATGLQDKFSWRDIAAAAAGGVTGYAAGQAMAPALSRIGNAAIRNIAGHTVSGVVGGITQAAVNGGKIDYTMIAADAFGNALGNSIVDKLNQPSAAERQQQTNNQTAHAFLASYNAQHPNIANEMFPPLDLDLDIGPLSNSPAAVLDGGNEPRANTTAQRGDSISRITRTSDPVAIEAFMRANRLTNSTIYAGRDYVLPGEADYAASNGRLGQTALNADNARLASIADVKDYDSLVAAATNDPNSFYGTSAQSQLSGYSMDEIVGARASATRASELEVAARVPRWVERPVANAMGDFSGTELVLERDSQPMNYGDQMKNVGAFFGDLGIGAVKGIDNLIPETGAFVYRMAGYSIAGLTSLVDTDVSDKMFAHYSSVTGRIFEYDNAVQHVGGIAGQLAAPSAFSAVASRGASLYEMELSWKTTINYDYRHYFSGSTVLDAETTFYSYKNLSFFKSGSEFASNGLWLTPELMTSQQAVQRLALPYSTGYDTLLTVTLPKGTTIMNPRSVWSLFGRPGGGIETRVPSVIASDMYTVGRAPK